MKVVTRLKTRVLATLVAGVLLVGGATAAFAATPAAQHLVQTTARSDMKATVTATHSAQGKSQANSGKDASKSCAGQPEAQNLATNYQLSSQSTSNAMKAICALHQNTFTGSTTGGASVSSSRTYGYGEINQLLTYARYLASHDSSHAGGKLSDSNVSSYLADALNKCGSTALESCLKTGIPGFQPGQGNGKKPASVPTTHGNKPSVTPTPNGNKPPVTPTPQDSQPTASPTPRH